MDISIMNLLNSPEFQQLITLFIAPLAVNSISDRLKALKAAIKDKAHEEQLLDCLEKAFFETERACHWKHDTEAIYETFMGSLMSFSNTFNKDALAEIFKDAIGADVTDDEISLWVDNLLKQITLDEHNELFKYLLLNNIIVDKPSPQPQVTLNYLLTYTTPVWDNKDVICREDIISELFAKFSRGTRQIQVAGMGGLGKSEILVKFFFQLNQPNPPVQFDYIGFIRFNDDLESNLRSQIPYLANYASKNGEEVAKLFLQQLCATKRVLFCIDDNRDKKDVLKKNDPSFAFLKTLNASILFASRTEYADFEQQPLPPLSTKACIEVFQRMYGQEIHNQKDIDILTKIIKDMSGNNTLIANRLGTMAKENNFTIDKLLKNLQDKNFHIKTGCMDEEELQKQISKLYPLGDLTKQGERSIVEAFSIFPVNPLPIDLCVDWLHEDAGIDTEECSLALTRLSKQTWLEKRINIADGDVLFSMHQCVKSATKDQMTLGFSSHENLVRNCTTSLDNSINTYRLQTSRFILPFAKSIFNLNYRKFRPFADLAETIARYYDESVDLSLACKWHKKTLSILKSILNKDDPDIATAYNHIGCVYYNLREPDLALEWFFKALKICETKLGFEHANTATTYNNIAGVYHSLEIDNLAIEWYKKSLNICEKVLGPDHLDTGRTYHNIAVSLCSMSDFDQALEWFFKSLSVREKILGVNHPDTASTYNGIGVVYRYQNKFDLAYKWLIKSLKVREKVFGKEHVTTSSSYSNLGALYRRQGEYELAIKWYMKELHIDEKFLGKRHLDTLTAYNNIAVLYQDQSKYELAHEMYEKALLAFKEKYGMESKYTQKVLNNIKLLEAQTRND